LFVLDTISAIFVHLLEQNRVEIITKDCKSLFVPDTISAIFVHLLEQNRVEIITKDCTWVPQGKTKDGQQREMKENSEKRACGARKKTLSRCSMSC